MSAGSHPARRCDWTISMGIGRWWSAHKPPPLNVYKFTDSHAVVQLLFSIFSIKVLSGYTVVMQCKKPPSSSGIWENKFRSLTARLLLTIAASILAMFCTYTPIPYKHWNIWHLYKHWHWLDCTCSLPLSLVPQVQLDLQHCWVSPWPPQPLQHSLSEDADMAPRGRITKQLRKNISRTKVSINRISRLVVILLCTFCLSLQLSE